MVKHGLLLKLGLILFIVIAFVIYARAKTEENILSDVKNEVFIDVTEYAGLDRNSNSYSHCLGDINNDDLPDIFVINHVAPPSLFKNNGDGTFSDISRKSGIARWGDLHGCAIGDYDNDGDQDIYVTVGAQKGRGRGSNRLYQNDGHGRFVDVASKAGVTNHRGRGRAASWVDYNNDGYLDLFVANRKRDDAPSVLFENNHDGTFSDVSVDAGLNIVDNLVEASWVDYNIDGFMDLTITIYRKHLKGEVVIYRNLQNGTFRKSLTFYGRTYAWGDYDDDGDLDIFISNPPRLYVWRYELAALSKIFRGFNKLYENVGHGKFVDVSGKAGFQKEMGGDKAVFFDYDNDGDQDIYLLISGTKSKNINDIIFKNNGDKSFINVTEDIGLVQNFSGSGCGVAYSDYSNNGFQDIFLTNGKWSWAGEEVGPYVLYKNKGNNNHWLKIKLIGTKSNRDGIGSQIKLYIGDQIQYRQNNGGMEGYIQNSNLIHFGLGKATRADKIEIIWPSGLTTSISEIRANQTLVIREKNHEQE